MKGGTKAGAAKRRQTMIDKNFNGDEKAYIEAQRASAAKGGASPHKKRPGSFKHRVTDAKRFGKKFGALALENHRIAKQPINAVNDKADTKSTVAIEHTQGKH